MEGVWLALKALKQELKELHMKEFQGKEDKIILCRKQLESVQTGLVVSPSDSDLLTLEKEV